MDTRHFLKFYTDTPRMTHTPGLEVMRDLLARLGNPQDDLRYVHIAGTNGKGSCAAMTAAVLTRAGYKTGLYTSPHLLELEERIQVNGAAIPLPALDEITAAVKLSCEGLEEPSFFEKITAAAFLYFQQQGCEFVVLETGLGGRLDGTNVIQHPACVILTPIGLDHTALLGDTLAQIAEEKCGIIKAGCPVVSAPQAPAARDVIRRVCREKNAPLREVYITNISVLSRSLQGQRFSYGNWEAELSLLGDHQTQNACNVIEAARILGIGREAVLDGLRQAVWPCRLEVFPGSPPVVLDGAHNPQGAESLAAGLRQLFPAGQKFTMIMGTMADKDYKSSAALLEPLAARFICLAPEGPRGLPAAVLAKAIPTVPVQTALSPSAAMNLARSWEEPVCAFGSLYCVGQLRRLLTEKPEQNLTATESETNI